MAIPREQYTKPFPSLLKPTGKINLANNGTATFKSSLNRQTQRQIVITNYGPGNVDITVDGTIGGCVFAGTAWTVETEEEIGISNTSGAAIDYAVFQVFYDAGTPTRDLAAIAIGGPGAAAAAAAAGASGGGGGYVVGSPGGGGGYTSGGGRTSEP